MIRIEVFQQFIAAVAILGIVAPASPEALGTIGRTDVDFSTDMIDNPVDSGRGGEGRLSIAVCPRSGEDGL